MDFLLLLILLLTVLVLLYYYVQRKQRYWQDKGVPSLKPHLFWGNVQGVGSKTHIQIITKNFYERLKGQGQIGGAYLFMAPMAVVTDLEFAKHMLIKDFQSFHDRGMYVNERDDPLSAHLFSLEGNQWKTLRSKLSPTFTSGKMKMMHPTILEVAHQFQEHLLELVEGGKKELEMKELLARFTTDVIANVAFGVQCNSMNDEANEFRRIGRKIVSTDARVLMKQFFVGLFPELSKKLGLSMTTSEVTNFFMKFLADTVEYREGSDEKRSDFMSLLLQLKNTGKLDGESADLGLLTYNELAAQVFLFFLAGFETSSSTMTFVLYELALNQEIQEKAREEVKEAMRRHGGKLTYEAAMELQLVDKIIHETLRKYPVVGIVFRKATTAYKVPNTEIVLEKGTRMIIPVMGFHMDPEIFPDPDKFDPERFSKEQVEARHPMAYLPFGQGPRICVGMRFGMMQTRLGIATILDKFRINPSSKTLVPMQFEANAQFLSPVGGMVLNLEEIKEE